ncbi:hypothetical protein NHX12_000281 [Muraenolepis orangiensis]|uniref:Uncharacterized protein n=1 Tax=Muraenolepis orangiensis TaxID=630683 RepID=A0A9Q0I1Q7_9TELE|nr:hypothetical protein NHX12_000281 [Muraenolepis orangiensis]
MASFGAPPVSLRHGVRLVAQAASTVEQVLLAVGDQVGHVNISYASRMNKAVVVFLKDQKYVTELIESGLVLNEEYVQVSPLATPSTRITVSGVPLFIPNEALERELKLFDKRGRDDVAGQVGTAAVGQVRTAAVGQVRTAAVGQVEAVGTQQGLPSGSGRQKELQQAADNNEEKAKGALIRVRFTSMRDIDAPTTFFFNLERSVGQRKQMVCLRLPDGQVTSEPAEMRRHAVSFYTDLFKAKGYDVEASDELFQGLPQLSPAESDTLGSDITLEELTSAGQRDIQELQDSLALYRKASSAKVNWEKSEAVLVGQWSVGNRPSLPGSLGWGNRGLKVLGVWLGSEDMVAQSWEGLLGKVQAKLAKWKWLLPQLSYRGRVLVANNLVASSLWHRLQVITPPLGLMKQLQRLLVDFFWSGHHWVPASVLYLPVAEGGQGLVDITARTAAFRLQAAQRLLYGASPCWLAMARLLLCRAGGFGFDKHLFLLKAPAYEITGLAPFYCSVINAWKILSFTRPPDPQPGMWLFEEPLFDTGFFPGTLLPSSATLRNAFVEAGVVKLGHLAGSSTEELAEVTGIRSIRVLENLVDEVWQSLSPSHRTFALDADLADQWRKGHDYVFPALSVGPAVGEWREEDGLLLSLWTLTPGEFCSCSGKKLYLSCVKVLNLSSLAGVRESRWTDVFGLAFSPQGS